MSCLKSQANGNCGSFMTDALLKTSKHTVTALTRDNISLKHWSELSKTRMLLVITLDGHASEGTELTLIEAAGDAGVKWIMPNEWCPDTTDEALVKDVFVFHLLKILCLATARKAIVDYGKINFITLSTGFWYEWSLAIPSALGIGLINHTATLFDEGETKVSISTWPQERNRIGFAKMLYTRVFYPDGWGNTDQKGTLNDMLSLPEDDIDEANKVNIERSKTSPWG
ncbi:hypothetical protein N7448_007134 [Penicillium atrosanguineum]|uniref:NmrA-like domain-containing protein n=1 Tax=Penicillium atrosanguineum TaxID=1132637 RepID=A0A9W9U2C5_9EURO|nr:uncharacterized protein N7443_010896 [Penicillium atrosanguineum]KAJ5132976.1 hypothetical protein N7448_007134 [Penicillium atrosanguineum]KAJ5141131.1 hypothetical protein N7526_002126 [Penicillium atrosanguineum]KAJ5290643.1 hypothetical protein N7443_010896 [Penicillium atrosanguineum]KAJ5308467.1 hypothetical protein N7476_009123 [Penicillium atrosanguineum]